MAAKNFNSQLAGQIGESLVVAELGRRGFVATAFSGNVPNIDLLAYKDRKTFHLQVKALRKGAISFNATRFLKIMPDGDKQRVVGLQDGLDINLIYVFVSIGLNAGSDSFFIIDECELAELIKLGYQEFLDKHGGVRPRNAATTHAGLSLSKLEAHKDNWALLDEQFFAAHQTPSS